MTEPLLKLSNRWRKSAEVYLQQVEEARKVGTPWDGMLATGVGLRACAAELDKEIALIAKEEEQPRQSIMDINAAPGSNVVMDFPENGWPHDHEVLASCGITKGATYTVDRTEVARSSTDLHLREFPGFRFNVVNFRNA